MSLLEWGLKSRHKSVNDPVIVVALLPPDAAWSCVATRTWRLRDRCRDRCPRSRCARACRASLARRLPGMPVRAGLGWVAWGGGRRAGTPAPDDGRGRNVIAGDVGGSAD